MPSQVSGSHDDHSRQEQGMDLSMFEDGAPTLTGLAREQPGAELNDLAARFNKSEKAHEGLKDKLGVGREKDGYAWKKPTDEELAGAEKAGRFASKPGELFLEIFAKVVECVAEDPGSGLVSPPLLGAMGEVKMSIISTIPDIVRHYASVIVQAQHEVFLATNYWEASTNATAVTESLRELSRRAEQRGKKVVVKLMYDRGTPAQIVKPHHLVAVEDYTSDKVQLPAPDEVPGIDMQVVNYHEPPVGTFHSKFMVVDRRIALLGSNNIQDRVNVEMCTHIEGPIVQSFYDMALHVWGLALEPPLPLLEEGIPSPPPDPIEAEETPTSSHKWDATLQSAVDRLQATLNDSDSITTHLNTGTPISGTYAPTQLTFKPLVLHSAGPAPMALVNRRPRGPPGHGDWGVPQDIAWLAALAYAKEKVFIQTPTFNAKDVVEATLVAVKRGIEVTLFLDLGFNDEGELLPMQGGTNEMVAVSMYKRLETDEEKDRLKICWYTAADQGRPLNAKDKSRNCHIKIMIVDGEVGIQGNGNQDTQSWYHSCEINVMVDSRQICEEWYAGLLANQQTLQFGRVENDGVWRDKDGNMLEGSTGKVPHGPMKLIHGIKGAIQRVRGEGGF